MDANPAAIGIIHPYGSLVWEPYGEMPYLEFIAMYSEKAFDLKKNGVSEIHIEEMDSLSEARAAVLGARQAKLPLYVSLAVGGEGVTVHDADLLASLIILQGLGITAFGFHCSDDNTAVLELADKLLPHANIPLMVTLDNRISILSDSELTEFANALLKKGISIINCTDEVSTEQKTLIKNIEDNFDASCRTVLEPEQADIAACSTQTFYLRDDMVYSRPLQCHFDMCDDIINAEDDGCEVVVVQVVTIDDAYQFGLNCHLIRVPVAIISDSDEALEGALLLYNGRAIIDYLCDIPAEVKETLAKGYNSLII